MILFNIDYYRPYLSRYRIYEYLFIMKEIAFLTFEAARRFAEGSRRRSSIESLLFDRLLLTLDLYLFGK